MKYIDAELLQKEIERQIMGIIKKQDANPDIPKHRWYLYEGMKEAFNDIGGFIDSLQQEQPDFPTTDEQIKEFLATHPKIEVPEKYKNPDWLFKKQEKPEVDFEKEWDEFEDWMESYITSDYPTYYAPKDIARHFYELGSQSNPEVFDTVAFQRGVQEGRRLEREDALTVADIEKLHTFLYAVKNNKHGAFTFTRLTDEQYEEVLRRFNNARTEE